MSVGKVCSRTTHLADIEESVQVAADRMKEENVGTLVVIDGERKPVGILTDRDVAVRLVAPGLDARTTTVGQVMTAHPRYVSERTPIEDAVKLMRRLAVRRLPVVDRAGRLAGIVSIDDVLEFVTEELINLGRIVGSSRPGSNVPSTETSVREKPVPPEGLQRASADLEC